MTHKAVALLSGGLDSRLAIRLMLDQGIEVEALNFRTLFACCQDDARGAAIQLGVRLTVLSQGDDYFDLIKRPKYGHGSGMNPCVDCRIYMFQLARSFMDRIGASFVISGEVLGQRPMSQLRKQLAIIERDSDLEGLLLRPLSAQLLDPTVPEKEGIVDRARLLDISGRSRKRLLEIAGAYGLPEGDSPSSGCALTVRGFSNKVRDLLAHKPDAQRWDFELLKVGRHLRLDDDTRVVIGRNEQDSLLLERLFLEGPADSVTIIRPGNFQGPPALLVGEPGADLLQTVGAIIVRYAGIKAAVDPVVECVGPHMAGPVAISRTLDEEQIAAMNTSLHLDPAARAIKQRSVLYG